jgi:tRNA modification GTPase
MTAKLSGWDDTIVALATPPGVGAIAVIRLSGQKSMDIIDVLFPAKKLSVQPSHTLHVGMLVEDSQPLDEVVISLYKNPRSYTGEDVVEISTHGSPFVQEQILQATIRKGARLARAGEFTQRAFLHGKLDLTQAEGVADLIASHSEASHKSALHTMRGGFSQDLKLLRDRLLSFSALIELELDFSQEDVEFADRKQFYQLIDEASIKTQQLIESFRLGNVIRNGVQVAIIGRPNAGKSTLLNALLNENRAIVSEIPGTTRDTIEETIHIDGILFRLIDTAGIRSHSDDRIENMGMEKSREKMEQADIVISLFDVGEVDSSQLTVDSVVDGRKEELIVDSLKLTGADIDSKFLFVGNKTDTIGEEAAKKKFHSLPHPIFISAKLGHGLDQLKKSLVVRMLEGKTSTEGTIVTNTRHFEALQQVASALADIRTGLDRKLSGDLLSLDIRRCLHWLGEITGEITNEDQLDYIFSKFCIGK